VIQPRRHHHPSFHPSLRPSLASRGSRGGGGGGGRGGGRGNERVEGSGPHFYDSVAFGDHAQGGGRDDGEEEGRAV